MRRRVRRQRITALAFVCSLFAALAVVAVRASTDRGAPRTGGERVARAASRSVRQAPRMHPREPVRLASTLASRHASAPILMYHVIASPPAGAPFPGLYVQPAEFAAQMRALDRAGFRAVTLDQLHSGWAGAVRLPLHPVVITFDNGYRSQYTQALPILRRLGWVADENLQMHGLPPRQGGLTPREVRAMVGAGWEFDTQGWDHSDLTRLDPAQLRFQTAVVRRRLQALYHVPVNWFCYPSGRYNPAVSAAVQAAGYTGSTTVVPGWATRNDTPYALPRLRVLAGTSPGALLAQIAAARADAPPPDRYLSAT